MELTKLLCEFDVEKVIGNKNLDIFDVVNDYSSVTKGALYICLKGSNFDGHDFVKNAEYYGAVAIVCEKEVNTSLTQIIVKNSRIAMSLIASCFFGHPEKSMDFVGITGTNGKTSTSHMIYSILSELKIKCGLIGTIGVYYGQKFLEPTLTTPDPLTLFRILNDMLNDGIKIVIMEVSAHAIFFDKIYGISFKVGVFTNLTQDHLDFFENMEKYKKEKIRFFTEYKPKYSVINSDDETGREIINSVNKSITYGLNNPADVFAVSINEKNSGISFVLNMFDKIYNIESRLFGLFNVYNIMAAAVSASLLGVSVDEVAKTLNDLTTINGRVEKIYEKDFSVYIDYAHTPDGLKKVLLSLREICSGNLICVFGCGGNRDKAKREIMGEISGKYADFTVITSDNPRFEEPMDIIFDIEKGVLKSSSKYVLIQDRKDATEYALSIAVAGDIVLIAGKGAENYQDILGIKKPYNDKDTVVELIGSKN